MTGERKVPEITGSELGRQAWVGWEQRKPRESRNRQAFRPVTATNYPGAKPRPSASGEAGGFWTSTFDERYGSAWIQWRLGEEWHCNRNEPLWHLWLLDPIDSARIVEIDSYADLAALVNAYPAVYDLGRAGRDLYPAWDKIAADYDAVHLTENGQAATRLTYPLNLYTWDCESTLWLRWAFASIEDAGERVIEPEPDAWWVDEPAEAAS